MKEYVFRVSFIKTIKADTENNALKGIADKTSNIDECKKVELLRIK